MLKGLVHRGSRHLAFFHLAHITMQTRTLICCLIAMFAAVPVAPPSAMGNDGVDPESLSALMPAKHQAVFARYCLDCHSADAEEGGVNLEDIPLTISRDIPTADLWQKVLNAVNSGEMPPPDMDPMTARDKTAFLEDLTAQMVIARKILGDSGGVIHLRRLNRREYGNTIEDLLGVRADVTSLPDDQVGSGFDTQGASLFFSSDQLENYLTTATDALKLCLLPAKQGKSNTRRVDPEETYTKQYRDYVAKIKDAHDRSLAWKAQKGKPPSAFGILDEYQIRKSIEAYRNWSPQLIWYLEQPETKTGAILVMTIKAGGYTRVKIPQLYGSSPGKYTISVRAAHYPEADSRFHYLELSEGVGSTRKHLAWRKVTATLDDPEILTFEYVQQPGKKTQLWLTQRTHQDRGDKNLSTKHQKENGLGTIPGVWVDWAKVSGPQPIDTAARAAARILFDKPKDVTEDRYVIEVLRRFAMRAFRGTSPDGAYLKKLFEHYQEGRESGQSLEEALINPLAIILSSPEFLYMVESETDDNTKRLSDPELAVRLSYFLWSSQPDDDLIRTALKGKLSDPAELKRQTDRLLRDPRHLRFVNDFTYQWLDMKRLGMFQFDGLKNPTFDNATRENARQEIIQMVETVMQEDRPIGELLDADYVVVNDVMADFYGLPKVDGHEFRKVKVPRKSPRGGLLGTAAISAMGSDGLRSSPVERGAWVMRHLLNDPPAPAPPNVPQLSRLDGEPLSARELQRAHQEEPQCAQCHRKIDPIGFGLENFAADGLWRESETARVEVQPKGKEGKSKKRERGKRGKRKFEFREFPIDAKGQLPTGEKFNDYFGLRKQVARHEEDFARGLTEALIAYGLGRPYGFTDQALADAMMEAAKERDYTFRAFVESLIASEAFHSR